MIITSRQFYSSIWLVIALIIATLLALALPSTLHAQSVATKSTVMEGSASWYNMSLHGRKTASGERYDHTAMTAAHASLPFDTMVKVTNLDNNVSVVVRINDRMKSGGKHIIDLSGAAAKQIGLFEVGTAPVRMTILSANSIAADSSKNLEVKLMNEPATVPMKEKSAIKSSPNSQAIEVSSKINPSNLGATDKAAYTLQIGSFSTLDRAKVLANQFKEAWIDRIETDGEVSFRVYFSRFEKEQFARVAQNDLWVKGQDSFLRKVGP